MSRFLFVTWDGGGNVNPALAICARLLAREHGVRVLGPPTLAARFEAEGAVFVARDPEVEWDTGAMASDVVVECGRAPTDALVVDYMLPGALCGAERSGLPTAAFVHTLYGALLDGDGDELWPMAMAATVEEVNAVRGSLKLPEIKRLAQLLDRVAQVLVLGPAELDEPSDGRPNLWYVGPVLEDAGPDQGWRPTTERPLVVVSFGTTPEDELPVLERVLAALGGLPVEVFATVGDHIDPAGVAAPPNATVSGYVRHATVLPHAALLVTHAGLGSVLAALATGVPMVCLPLGREQPQNAAAVERVGAGRVLGSDAPAEAIREAIADVLATPAHRRAAQAMAARIDPSGQACVEALEGLAAAN